MKYTQEECKILIKFAPICSKVDHFPADCKKYVKNIYYRKDAEAKIDQTEWWKEKVK